MKFYKYQGTGNDFVLIDNRGGELSGNENELFARMCRRHFGIGADGVILLNPDPEVDFYMDYFNSDGNRSTMCGNGGRCMAAFAKNLGLVGEKTLFRAIDGFHEAAYTSRGVKLKMTLPQGFRTMPEGNFWLDTGSPHYVQFQETPVSQTDVFQSGKSIRNREDFVKEGTNVNFVNVLAPGKLKVRTYERGVEDETLSCGTGVTACAEVWARLNPGYEGPVEVETEGGTLWVHVKEGEAPWLEGPAEFVFAGKWP
ncbi:MAG: diaminopimelate epimerase [Bacteroidia bacterium]|nr:diaminopimelate epimerase [Bacteroidia bacterium]